ncbi:MAG: GHMP kinase [Desulfurococcales archaeon]|nr:GHMP kinase [Desulfurococcales archaeon]
MRGVLINAPAHLHVGNPDIEGRYGRLYGTLGFTVSEPKVVVRARPGEPSCQCSRWEAEKIFSDFMVRYRECPVQVEVVEEIPPHIGLGSTTPLLLSIAHAISTLCGKRFDPLIEAPRMGRGLVSGLGVHSYVHGGFIVDGGFRTSGKRSVPPLIFRAEIPGNLSFLIAVPSRPLPRILRLKEKEDEILEQMPKMDPQMADKLSRIVLMGILPYIAEGDWITAGKHITLFNRMLGEYWSKEQGGIYCCEESEILVELMEKRGAVLVAQSSWGPTVYGLFPEKREGEILPEIQETIETIGGGQAWIANPRNRGAKVIVQW